MQTHKDKLGFFPSEKEGLMPPVDTPALSVNSGSCLTTDMYQYTMAFAYYHRMVTKKIPIPQTSFDMYYRVEPFKGTYALFCGLKSAVDYLQGFHFDKARLKYLRTILEDQAADKAIVNDFINYLQTMEIKFNLWSVKDGTPVHANQLVMRVETNALLAQIWETPLLSIVGYATLVATNTSRIVQAADGRAILEFGARRSQNEFGIKSSLYAYYGGAVATSNMEAGYLYNIPVKGTHSHAWVMLSKTEQDAFDHYAEAFPKACVLLVDTIDPLLGVDKAIITGKKLKENGSKLAGIRIDSGGKDMAELIKTARAKLDAAGFHDTTIIASDDLDEDKINELLNDGAQINSFGVGTRLVTCPKQPAMGMVYKANAAFNANTNQWEHKMKICSPEKQSIPARKNVAKFIDPQSSKYIGSVVYNVDHPPKKNEPCAIIDMKSQKITIIPKGCTYEPQLVQIFEAGKLIYRVPTPSESRAYGLAELKKMPEEMLSLKNPKSYPTGITNDLKQLTIELVDKIKNNADSEGLESTFVMDKGK